MFVRVREHDGASSRPEICREILERVERPNAAPEFRSDQLSSTPASTA